MSDSSGPPTVRTVADLRAAVATWRSAGETIALVPTMGALHEGHLSLVRAAHANASKVVATLFVNPTQFGENEDLSTYPRDEDRDRELFAQEKVDLLFAPAIAQMYGENDSTRIDVGELGTCLDGEYRPGFFVGVATVVAKLLLQSLPDVALFGEKDFQQLQVIRRMVSDLHIPVEIMGVPTVREADGLALSSRNAYLTPEEREAAPALYSVLNKIADAARSGGDLPAAIDDGMDELRAAGFSSVDYLTVRNADTFAVIDASTDLQRFPGRVLGAAHLGKARLIDNVKL
ncbi:MAG: pantoate--beta-alanine ligase [Rhodospirillales bacterium]|nr:pantoate--beta-alanine ligase [Rhodospirillales bacterium]